MFAVSYRMKRKIKKIFLKVISNTKIVYLKICLINLPTIKILSNLQGTRQRGGTGQRRMW